MAAESIGSLMLESNGPVSEVVPTTLDFVSLVEQHTDFVFRTLRQAGLDAVGAEDAAQQVFLVVSRKMHLIVAGKERAFLYRTARNVAAELRRRSSKRAEVELVEEQEVDDSSSAPVWSPSSLDEVLDQQRARAVLLEVIGSMPEHFREVFVLCELEEMSAPEAAASLDIPLGTVASRLSRARQAFDECLTRIQARRAFRRPL